MLMSPGTLIGYPSGNKFSAYGTPGFSLTAPVLAFVSATTPSNDATQDFTIDIADPGALEDDEIVVVAKIGTDFTGSSPSEYDVIDTYTVLSSDVGGGGDFTGEITLTLTSGVAYCRAFHKRGGSYSSPSTTISKTIDLVAPTFTSATTANCAENATLSHALTANESVTFALNGGDDEADFQITGSELQWASDGTKDYETPDDTGTNNVYNVTVRATDTAGNTTDQNIAITVTDVAESVGYVKTDNPAVQDLSYGSATATFSNCAVGTAATDRVVIVCIANNARTLTGVTIGSVTATEAVSSNTGAHTAIWYAIVPTGTTATVVITAAANFGKIGITVGKLNSATSAPTSTGLLAAGFRAAPQLASSATIPANGVGVIAMGDIDTAQGTLTWNNATEDYSTTGTAFGVASGNKTDAGAFQASISGVAFNNISMAVACWGP